LSIKHKKMKSTKLFGNYGPTQSRRIKRTLKFISSYLNPSQNILDLGSNNPLAEAMRNNNLNIQNTPDDLDLDLKYDIVKNDKIDVITAFEIFEHMVSPFPLLKEIKAPILIASVPLKLWFASAYWNEKDPYDRHYHEFEQKQFDMLLNKAGWNVINSEKWPSEINKIGIRPILRLFTPRYYIVYCERK